MSRLVSLFVLLQVELVGLGPDFPVDVPDVVARHILAMLGELDGEAVVRAGMHPGHVTLDHHARLQVQPLDASQRERI